MHRPRRWRRKANAGAPKTPVRCPAVNDHYERKTIDGNIGSDQKARQRPDWASAATTGELASRLENRPAPESGSAGGENVSAAVTQNIASGCERTISGGLFMREKVK